MIVQSFFSQDGRLQPMQVEVQLLPGLPQLQFIGLPDTHLKESGLRIKSALKSQGFTWPKNQQVVVNLRPSHIRKHSRGLDLAIAFALIMETEQLKDFPIDTANLYVYGELGLSGEVLCPEDLESVRSILKNRDQILCSKEGVLTTPGRIGIGDLQDLHNSSQWSGGKSLEEVQIPHLKIPNISFSKQHAELLMLASLSEASVLLAGPPGSGKTTFAESLYYLQKPLTKNEYLDLRAHHLQLGQDLKQRPLIAPHHSTPVMSLIGGGGERFPGEVAKAHGGLLILDEFLLFPSRVLEALREPLVSKKLQISRRGKMVEWPANFQFVSTTNLCPCGKMTKQKTRSCGYTLSRCRSTWERMSGPMLDRFDLVILFEPYSYRQKSEEVSLASLVKRVSQARMSAEMFPLDADLEIPEIFRLSQSRRRERALRRLAWAQAVLEGSNRVLLDHWSKAYQNTHSTIEEIHSLFG